MINYIKNNIIYINLFVSLSSLTFQTMILSKKINNIENKIEKIHDKL